MNEDELKATEQDGAVRVQQSEQTFVPHSHPFAHARLMNVVCRVANIDRTIKVRVYMDGWMGV